MSDLGDILASIEIAAPPARAWNTLTDAKLVAEWLGAIGFQPELGSIFYMQPDKAKADAGDMTGATNCEVEILEPPRRIGFSWFLPGYPVTHVMIDVTPAGAGSTVRLLHTGWDGFTEDRMDTIHRMLAAGWQNYVLPNLKRVVEA